MKMINRICCFLVLICYYSGVSAQFYENQRCRCVCPSPASVFNKTQSKMTDRKLYSAYVPPSKCNCGGVILPHVSDEIRDNAQVFCPRCDCKYESRNTTIIMVVVIMVLWVLMLLSAYLIFLMILDPLLTQKQRKVYIDIKNADEAQSFLINGEEPED
ncbi:uncharacterized protein CG1161-like [Zerene cesonia]|uniref:uncharacterized protein CG1161-like n=1 Tax=Zerene cesonia TaxID=33412 RepID=UPI0018E569E0|nr:uncharacterized protein CG1161-like [Zerene cesonia]